MKCFQKRIPLVAQFSSENILVQLFFSSVNWAVFCSSTEVPYALKNSLPKLWVTGSSKLQAERLFSMNCVLGEFMKPKSLDLLDNCIYNRQLNTIKLNLMSKLAVHNLWSAENNKQMMSNEKPKIAIQTLRECACVAHKNVGTEECCLQNANQKDAHKKHTFRMENIFTQ